MSTTLKSSTSFLGLLSPSVLSSTLRTHPHHIIALLASTIFGLGGLGALYNPRSAIKSFGLPDYVADSHPAQVCFQINGSSITTLAVAIAVFYSRGKLAEVDTLIGLVGFTGVVGGLVCLREGREKSAVGKWVAALFAAGWGLRGCTEHGVF